MPIKRSAAKRVTSALAAAGLVAVLPAGASAKPSDRDRDGLSAKTERRLGTNPRRADTDRDRLKDGREVKLGTNPRKADTDGDGIRDDREVRTRSNPRSADTDGDGIEDRYEYGVDGEADELKGTLVEIGTDSVTINDRNGVPTVVQVTSTTRIRSYDLDGDGRATLADFQVGNRVEAHTQPGTSGPVALSLKNESSEDRGGGGSGDDQDNGDDGDGPEAVETHGVVSSLDGSSVTVTRRDGSQTTLEIDDSTYLRGPDRDGDGRFTLADLQAGDRVEARTAVGSNLALSLKVEVGSHDDSDDDYEIDGAVAAIGSDTITVTRRDGSQITLTVDAATRLEVVDRDGDGRRTLADFRVGDRVEVKAPVGSLVATKIELDD